MSRLAAALAWQSGRPEAPPPEAPGRPDILRAPPSTRRDIDEQISSRKSARGADRHLIALWPKPSRKLCHPRARAEMLPVLPVLTLWDLSALGDSA